MTNIQVGDWVEVGYPHFESWPKIIVLILTVESTKLYTAYDPATNYYEFVHRDTHSITKLPNHKLAWTLYGSSEAQEALKLSTLGQGIGTGQTRPLRGQRKVSTGF